MELRRGNTVWAGRTRETRVYVQANRGGGGGEKCWFSAYSYLLVGQKSKYVGVITLSFLICFGITKNCYLDKTKNSQDLGRIRQAI